MEENELQIDTLLQTIFFLNRNNVWNKCHNIYKIFDIYNGMVWLNKTFTYEKRVYYEVTGVTEIF